MIIDNLGKPDTWIRPVHFRDLLSPVERLRYLFWRVTGAARIFQCRLKGGPEIRIRPRPNWDYDTAYEIFFDGIYRLNFDPASVQFIVDLGGNVGYSVLFWCWKYPQARVLVVEPHPAHCQILRRHMRDNDYADRVTLLEAAAAVDTGRTFLTDADDASTVVNSTGPTSDKDLIDVASVDFFEACGDGYIDILKIDIEGSEFGLFADTRFEGLAARVGCVVLEWHRRAADQPGPDWYTEKLVRSGFQVHPGRSCDEFGMLFASRQR